MSINVTSHFEASVIFCEPLEHKKGGHCQKAWSREFWYYGGMRRSGGAGVLSGDGITCKIPAKASFMDSIAVMCRRVHLRALLLQPPYRSLPVP